MANKIKLAGLRLKFLIKDILQSIVERFVLSITLIAFGMAAIFSPRQILIYLIEQAEKLKLKDLGARKNGKRKK